jgi:hypothetical protein
MEEDVPFEVTARSLEPARQPALADAVQGARIAA